MRNVKFVFIYTTLTLLTAAVFAASTDIYLENKLEGPNVCKKLETFPVEVVTTELQSYQERSSVWCLQIPPRCSTYRINHKVVNKTHTIYKQQIKRDCCDGYKISANGTACEPDCTQKCQHGKCIAPDKCKCDHGYGGPACDIICRCTNNSSCDPNTGRCICSPGWLGEDCSQPCSKGYYGMGCKEKCPEIMHGNKSCDHITGEIICRAGYIGITCEHPCPTGRYGPGCTLKCHCEHGGECNHITGNCQCLPGWTGPNCNDSCPTDYYGINCSQRCRCQNHQGCRKNDGLCICLPGWMGSRCDEVCPEGFYGQHCMLPCTCSSQNFVCHAAKGCVCRLGYTGENCDVPTNALQIQRADLESNRTGLAWGLVLGLIFVGVIIAVIFYYRRRVSNLKTEIQHVQYISDTSQGWPDRHNFDNPVYGLQGADSRLLNNLRPKMNNLDCNGSMVYGDDSNASSRAGTYSINYNSDMLTKNLNADLTNPNVYNCIDDALKEEHVYDEIKQKEGYKDPVKDYRKKLFPDGKKALNARLINITRYEYDHLDYSRPSTSQKPHYHRMNDTMLNINHAEEKPSNLKTMDVLLEKGFLVPDEKEENETCDSICDNTNLSTTSTASPSPSPKHAK
ncbi:protein draper isoform X7 [Teleopsis dalmanni]|uniref:protein draper isoform X7 n=1 Tax=Teleopsis dalmanni TaxID=139649 RepID=UPI0018CCC61B|nr:protein draper isoform X7 [Teleopsis dalmanni]